MFQHSVVKSMSSIFLFVLILLLSVSGLAQSSPLFGNLQPGPFPIGFKVINISDSSRLVRPKQDYFGNPASSDRTRQLYVHLWYPAKLGKAAPMTFADYVYSSNRTWPQTMTAAAKDKADSNVRNMIQRFFGSVTETAWASLQQTKLLARYNAEPAKGRFPLVVGTLREVSTTLTNEYLASHGYVVAFVQSANDRYETDDATLTALVLNNQLRDLELIVSQLREKPFVDPLKLATLGFSGSGLAPILFAMRHPDVDALALLETGMWGPLGSSYTKTPLYDVRALRVPFFFSYSDSSIGRWPEQQFAEFDQFKFSTRHYFKVNIPKFHHWDFATEGMAASTVLSLRGEQQTDFRQGFEQTNVYLLHFLNAYVKKQAESLASLRHAPASSHIVTLKEIPAIKAAPSRDELAAIIAGQGIERAVQVYREARKRDPEAAIFEEERMNQLANEMARCDQPQTAIELLKLNVEAHPQSVTALINLGNAYATAGQKELAKQRFERALALLPNDATLNGNQKEQMKQTLQQKIEQAR